MRKHTLFWLSSAILFYTLAADAQQAPATPNDLAVTEAKVEAAALRKKFGGDNAMETSFYNIYYTRRTEMNEAMEKFSGARLFRVLSGIVTKYDSIADHYISIAASNAFISKKIAMLDGIRPLAPGERTMLTDGFISLCLLRKDLSFSDNFTDAMKQALKDTVYYAAIYKDAVEKAVRLHFNSDAKTMMAGGQLTKDEFQSVSPLVFNKERALALIGYAYSDNEKDNLLERTAQRYDSLIGLTLLRGGASMSKSAFSAAVRNRKTLNLSDGQVDTLMMKAAAMDQLKKDPGYRTASGEKFSAKVYESEQMPWILTDDQYNQLLILLNQDQALTWAKGDWEELRKRSLTDDYDSAVVIKQIYNYDLVQLMAKQRYANDPVQLNAALTSSNETAPAALSRLKTARRRATLAANSNNDNYKW
jgi:hypothetical protein